MPRKATTAKVSVTLGSETLEEIDQIAASYEDFVSRGEVIDKAFDYILGDEDRVMAAFGPEAEDEDESKDAPGAE